MFGIATDGACRPISCALAAVAAATKEFSDEGLMEMRRRFAAREESPALLNLIDRELRRRHGALTARVC